MLLVAGAGLPPVGSLVRCDNQPVGRPPPSHFLSSLSCFVLKSRPGAAPGARKDLRLHSSENEASKSRCRRISTQFNAHTRDAMHIILEQRLIYRCAHAQCSFFSIIFGLPVMFCLRHTHTGIHTHTEKILWFIYSNALLGTNEKSCLLPGKTSARAFDPKVHYGSSVWRLSLTMRGSCCYCSC